MFFQFFNVLYSASLCTIVEEELEDLYSDSSEDELLTTAQSAVVGKTILSWRRVYNFPSPENYRQFVESPLSPTLSEGKVSPKYVSEIPTNNLFRTSLIIFLSFC